VIKSDLEGGQQEWCSGQMVLFGRTRSWLFHDAISQLV